MAIRVRLSSKFRMALLASMSVVALVATTDTAHAQVSIPGTMMFNGGTQDGYCAWVDSNQIPRMGGCGLLAGEYWLDSVWTIQSEWPDTGYANVWLKNQDGLCLATTSTPGPLANSLALDLEECDSSNTRERWSMTRAAATHNGLTPENFYAFDGHVCLDGGIGLYGYGENGCNPNNVWQRWDIYA